MEALQFYYGPLGRYAIRGTDSKLTRIYLGECLSLIPEDMEIRETPLLKEAKRQLDAYFAGQLRKFELPEEVHGTPFQMKVWNLLKEIPYGEVITYGELARRAGDHKACRAVGMANGRNALPVIIPCHRVIGAGGKLTGYTGGLEVKIKLLEIEGIRLKY